MIDLSLRKVQSETNIKLYFFFITLWYFIYVVDW